MSDQSQKGGGPPMVKIDGSKVRSIRENQGLTQLYVATAVGVTTDTISRWENNRYPAIKRENCLKLAKALEVEISDLLDAPSEEPEVSIPEEPPPAVKTDQTDHPEKEPIVSQVAHPSEHNRTYSRLLSIGLVILLIACGTIGGWFYLSSKKPAITAVRYAPAHYIPGIPLPVVIEVSIEKNDENSYVVKETVPKGSTVISTFPKIVKESTHISTLKWLNKDNKSNFYAYTLKTPANHPLLISYNGSISERRQVNVVIAGDNSSKASDFHWADLNTDGRIDDQEIMQAYNRFSHVPSLNFETIEEIWMGSGYTFDHENEQLVIF